MKNINFRHNNYNYYTFYAERKKMQTSRDSIQRMNDTYGKTAYRFLRNMVKKINKKKF